MSLVFVYGTLKRGYGRHFALRDQQFLGLGKTLAGYRLVNCGSYPGLLESLGGYSVEGELWEVAPACLKRLDAIEGVDDGLYERRPIPLAAPWNALLAEAYFYVGETDGMPDAGPLWS